MKSLLLPALLASSSIAADLTIKTAPLEATLIVETTFIPSEATIFRITPKQWTSFVITDLVDHGTSVKAGETLITFESADYQRHLAEHREAVKLRELTLAKSQHELQVLKITTSRALEGLKLTHDRAKEALDDFTTTGRALREEEAREHLEASKNSLTYEEEELEQLLKKHQDDVPTQETEDIILKRQRASVNSARFTLKKVKKSSAWALEKSIPNQAVDLKRSYDSALLAYETGKISLPRTLEEKKLALSKIKRDHAEADRKLAELEADAQFLTLTATTNGVIYHGEINDHSWSLDNSPKFLFKTGAVPANTALMTLVPNDPVLSLHGTLRQADRLKLPNDANGTVNGTANVTGLGNSAYPAAITALSGAPNREGRYHLAMSVELPEDSPIVTGMKANVKLFTYRKENAISVPTSAITTKDGISTVKLKMADGKNEIREVKLGRIGHKNTEILEGLEIDQVILVPDPPK